MNKSLTFAALGIALFLCGISSQHANSVPPAETPRLGNFSVSLNVASVAESRAFYEKLGFHVSGGDQKHYVIMQNQTATIGLYHGMFPKNILTFNPGWDRDKKVQADFDDVRAIQKTLKDRGLSLTTTADEASSGPAFLMLNDPDGNPILVDQHIPAPKK